MGCLKLHIDQEPRLTVAYSKKAQKPLKNTLSYYPFGLQHKGYNDAVSGNVNHIANRFSFGGKEYGEELGLDWYDISARNYDPAIGRWMNLDPLADQMRRHSPYNYAFDNPIFFFDPDGMAPQGCDWCKNFAKGIGEGYVKTFEVIGNAIAHPIDTFNNLAKDPVAVGEISLNVSTGGLYGTLKSDTQLVSAVVDGDANAAGQIVGQRGAEATIAAGTGIILSKTTPLVKNLVRKPETTTLYRGVNNNSPAFEAASNGKVKPRGGNATPLEHNTVSTKSKYTSWTTDPRVAKNFALRPKGEGVVLEGQISINRTVKSPDRYKVNLIQSPGVKVPESEVLVTGKVTVPKKNVTTVKLDN